MANLTTINTCISPTMFVELVFGEFRLSFVPRVVTFPARCDFLVLNFFIKVVRLRRTLKICFRILRLSPIWFTGRSTFTPVTSKIIVIVTTALTNVAVRTCVRGHRHGCLTLILNISGTTISWNIYGSRPPQTILSSIILQSRQRIILACLPIGH